MAWVSAAHVVSDKAITYLTATWEVPKAPSKDVGQTIFLFPGLQASAHVLLNGRTHHISGAAVLQPVLGWESSSGWTMENYVLANAPVPNDEVTGQVGSVSVKEGDNIIGTVTQSGTDYTMSFQINGGKTYSTTVGLAAIEKVWESTLIKGATLQGSMVFNEAVMVLEEYKVNDCSSYPDTSGVTFYNLQAMTSDVSPVNGEWTVETGLAQDPKCDAVKAVIQSPTMDSGQVEIKMAGS